MGGCCCCCCFHIRDPEEDGVSPRRTRTRISTLWNKLTGVNTNERSVAPFSTSQDLVPLNAASNTIITVGTRVLPIEGEMINSGEYKNERVEGWEDYRVYHTERVRKGKNLRGLQCESQLKFSPAKPEVACAFGSSEEDEDVCPTCLEEYIPENPRIILQCSHSYHLGCIYEWMERSSNCPICGKMMLFNEEA